MLGQSPFYHRTVRKYVTLFGALFNDIFVVRETVAGAKRERQKVPIVYGPKEKWLTRLQTDPTLTKSVMTTVPRMSFEMTSITYDDSRKQQSTIRHRARNAANTALPQSQYIGVPYNFEFNLSVLTKNIEDALQIVEQILPFFLPDYTVSAQLSQELDIVKDVPIILKSVNENIIYEGALHDGTRIITWDLTFLIKGFLFGPVSNTAIIKGVQTGNTTHGGIYVNLYTDVNNKTVQKVILTAGFGQYRELEPVRVPERDLTGVVYSWSNTSNTLYLTGTTNVLAANDEVWGLESGAHWTVQSLEVVPQKEVEILIRQTPITATEDDDYGYSTVITEFPDTLG
jgi:hypothetical protein